MSRAIGVFDRTPLGELASHGERNVIFSFRDLSCMMLPRICYAAIAPRDLIRRWQRRGCVHVKEALLPCTKAPTGGHAPYQYPNPAFVPTMKAPWRVSCWSLAVVCVCFRRFSSVSGAAA